jgi:hypothetical protein
VVAAGLVACRDVTRAAADELVVNGGSSPTIGWPCQPVTECQVAVEPRWNPGTWKVVGRLDSNQRPPAPKSAVSRFPAMLCETTIRLKLLMSNHFDACHRRTLHPPDRLVEPRWNPAEIPLSCPL